MVPGDSSDGRVLQKAYQISDFAIRACHLLAPGDQGLTLSHADTEWAWVRWAR
jgi:hypothetical protein